MARSSYLRSIADPAPAGMPTLMPSVRTPIRQSEKRPVAPVPAMATAAKSARRSVDPAPPVTLSEPHALPIVGQPAEAFARPIDTNVDMPLANRPPVVQSPADALLFETAFERLADQGPPPPIRAHSPSAQAALESPKPTTEPHVRTEVHHQPDRAPSQEPVRIAASAPHSQKPNSESPSVESAEPIPERPRSTAAEPIPVRSTPTRPEPSGNSIHIGSIEIRVVERAAVPPAPSLLPLPLPLPQQAAVPAAPGRSLSRGFSTPFGLNQG